MAGFSLAAATGCDYSVPDNDIVQKGRTFLGPIPGSRGRDRDGAVSSISARTAEERKAILDSSISLIERASIKPGGDNYKLAVNKLNQYFDEGTPEKLYQLDAPARDYLVAQLGSSAVPPFQSREWNDRDTRHIEDCMMYSKIAARVAGSGDDLARVRRLFDWIIRQVQLVPAGSFGGGRRGPAFARPYDVLMRGMATESEGSAWAERAWIFMAFCRQLDIDAGLLTFTRATGGDTVVSREEPQPGSIRPQKPRIVWLVAVLIDDRAYLFDTRLGLEVPGPEGRGISTLDDVLTDPTILERMNIPGLAPYVASRATLLNSPTKIGVLIDSSPGYFAPKMRLLQRELSGKYRTVLFSDPAVQRDHFARVLGPRLGSVSLWEIPLQVQVRLFNDAEFVQAIQYSLFWFRPEYPLIYARVKQLRGEMPEAISEYVAFRKGENVPLAIHQKGVSKEKQQTIPKDVQAGLDVYASYYLGLAHLENNNLDRAAEMFRQVVSSVPPPSGKRQPYYYMFQWGANANLARIEEARRNPGAAIDYYSQPDPTPQGVGNHLRARELIWIDPTH